MVQHLALSVERLRFRAGMAEDPNVKEVGSQGHWQVDPASRPTTSLSGCRTRVNLDPPMSLGV